MKKKRNYQLTYHPTQLNRKPETKLEKMYIYNNMIQTGTTIENICNIPVIKTEKSDFFLTCSGRARCLRCRSNKDS